MSFDLGKRDELGFYRSATLLDPLEKPGLGILSVAAVSGVTVLNRGDRKILRKYRAEFFPFLFRGSAGVESGFFGKDISAGLGGEIVPRDASVC